MYSSRPSAPRARRGAIAVGALAVSGAMLLSPVVSNAAPAQAAVSAAASSIVLSGASFTAGDTLTVEYATDQPHDLNWIGLYSKGQTPGGPASTLWQYATGEAGSVDFTLDLAAGEYELWFLAQDGYDVLDGPIAVTVAAVPDARQPGDANAPVDIDPVVTDITTDGVIVREGFDAGIPEGWTLEGGSDAAYGGWSATTRADWTADIDQMRGRFARPLGGLVVADAQQFGGALDTTLTSAPVDVAGLGSVRLTFDSHYRGAAGQVGEVLVSFDGGESTVVLTLDADDVEARQLNYSQDIVVEVPDGAAQAQFSWRFASEDAARYWAIDSVAVHEVQKATDVEPTQAWVMSDIQGHPQDWEHAIGDYVEIAPDADAMVIVGDLVNSGAEREWDEMWEVRENTADMLPRQLIATNGNHERYAPGGFASNINRFFEFAGRDQVFAEYSIDGPAGSLPVLVLGQEFASPSDVAMSDEQVEFLEERLAYWTEQDSQVAVLTHFPLGDTVSASWNPGYHRHHQMNDRLTSILGNYPNAVVFSGHTHYPAEQGDWAVQRRTADGHPDGFWAINTIAMHIEWDAFGEDTRRIRERTTRDINQGLTLDYYGDRMVVTAYDFFADEQLRQVEIPNPLVAFDGDELPAVVAGTPVITGDPVVGGTVSVDPGQWEEGAELSYQWMLDGEAIEGATESSFLIEDEANAEAAAAAIRAQAAAGQALTVEVTGTKPRTVATTVVSEPVTIQPAAEEPGEEPGEVPGEEPGEETPGEQPGEETPGEEPGEQPGGENPGEEPGGENPGEQPGGENPGEEPGEQPGEQPGGETPAEKPGDEQLPATGAELPWGLALGAALLAALGLGMIVRRRATR